MGWPALYRPLVLRQDIYGNLTSLTYLEVLTPGEVLARFIQQDTHAVPKGYVDRLDGTLVGIEYNKEQTEQQHTGPRRHKSPVEPERHGACCHSQCPLSASQWKKRGCLQFIRVVSLCSHSARL